MVTCRLGSGLEVRTIAVNDAIWSRSLKGPDRFDAHVSFRQPEIPEVRKRRQCPQLTQISVGDLGTRKIDPNNMITKAVNLFEQTGVYFAVLELNVAYVRTP